MTHTPGPWRVMGGMRKTLAGEHFCIWQVDAESNLAHTEPVATVWNYLHPGEGNALLVAAAPTLLAACETLVTALTEAADCLGDAGGYTEEMDAAIEEGTAAVAAAKGETP